MSERLFRVISDRNDGIFRQGVKVYCSECGASGWKSANEGAGIPPEVIFKYFKQKGWELSLHEGRDICPACVQTKRESRRMNIKLVKGNETMKADPPRELTREHRRIIYAKLNEVYIDEKTGYAGGWSDQRVATDLGCPVDWVRKEREEHFGSLAVNEDIQRFLKEALGTLEEAKKITGEAKLYTETAMQMGKQAQTTHKLVEGILERVKRLDDFADKLKKQGM